MNKDYYNELINEQSLEDNVSLDRLEIGSINEKRQQIFTISELIHNLDKLKIKVVEL